MTGATPYALAYACLGWPVLPLRPGSKAPATGRGFKDASTDPDTIRAWFTAWPDAGVGIHPGPAGLLVLDVDDKGEHHGSEELFELERVHGELPATQVQRTPSGARHLLFSLPEGVPAPGNAKLTPGIDVRSAAGYIAAEPTRLADGTAYSFEDWDILAGELPELAPAPGWLLALLSADVGQAGTLLLAPAATGEPARQTATPETIDDLRSALNFLDADSYPVWIDNGIRLKGLGTVGRELWMTWSQQSTKFDPREAAEKWRGFVASSAGYAGVFAAAQAAGWVNPRAGTGRALVPAAPVFPSLTAARAARNGGMLDALPYLAAGGQVEWLMAVPPGPHPLALFVDFDDRPLPPRWVIPGFIGHGLVVFAGAHGAGKTTALLPLALVAAGLHPPGDPLAPHHWRHVVYVTEDVEQARRILAGILRHSQHRPGLDLVRERVRVVEARRMPPSEVVGVADDYLVLRREVFGVELLPLVVFDTKSAVLDLEEENSNSEASAAIAMLKQRFGRMPVWLVGHVAKASLTRSDMASWSARGASAWDADANQVLYLVTEGEARHLVRGKTRFEARWPELAIRSHTATDSAPDEFGNLETLTLRWSHPEPPEVPRHLAREEAQEQARVQADAELRTAVLAAVQTAWSSGNPLNRAGGKAKVPHKAQTVVGCIECLIAEQWLHEVSVPVKERTPPRRSSFLVALTTPEHDGVLFDSAPVSAEKLAIPATWKKPIPSVPATDRGEAENDGFQHAA
ncbi:MAG: hypothetical protein RLZZ584_4499 [Pseudomonadota bacterium]